MDYLPPPDLGLDIVYCDASLLLVNKPSGLLSVPGRGPDKQDCLSQRVQNEFPNALVVHRLDMSTSGLLLMARGKQMQSVIAQLFEQRQVHKTYVAVVAGIPTQKEASINLPLSADWPNRPLQKIDHGKGKASITHYKLLETSFEKQCSRLELHPETGRSHQLRIHMQAIGHPILGDDLYADIVTRKRSSRLLLHAQGLSFKHPMTQELLTIHCPAEF